VQPEPSAIDERELRAAQGTIAVLLLGAFVFRVPVLALGIAVVVALGAAFGSRVNAFHAAYRAAVGPRLQPPVEVVAPDAVRALDALAAALLLLGSAAFAIGVDAVGWILVLVEAAVATVEATTGYNAALALLERLRRER
jgi:Domain of unknown function (DUF4395)